MSGDAAMNREADMNQREREERLSGLMESYDAKLLDRAKDIEPADLEPVDGEFLDLTVTVTMERETVEGIVGREISDELFAAE